MPRAEHINPLNRKAPSSAWRSLAANAVKVYIALGFV
jgi:hypothetical protein